MKNSFLCDDINPHLLRLVSSIGSQHKLSNQDWLGQWAQIFEVFSVQHGNGDDFGTLTIFNPYHASRGIDSPPIVPR